MCKGRMQFSKGMEKIALNSKFANGGPGSRLPPPTYHFTGTVAFDPRTRPRYTTPLQVSAEQTCARQWGHATVRCAVRVCGTNPAIAMYMKRSDLTRVTLRTSWSVYLSVSAAIAMLHPEFIASLERLIRSKKPSSYP